MILYGASGHAKVIMSSLEASGHSVQLFFDDDPSKTSFRGVEVRSPYEADLLSEVPLIISVGDNTIRQRLAGSIRHPFGRAKHPSVLLDPSVQVGEGTVLLQGSVVQADTQLGRHVIINTCASVDHDCRVADFVHIAPGARVCGGVRIGMGTLVGAGSVVAPNVIIGDYCLIAAGSIITRSIPSGAIVRGNPGRVLKIVFPQIP